jgi:hypothetical protein
MARHLYRSDTRILEHLSGENPVKMRIAWEEAADLIGLEFSLPYATLMSCYLPYDGLVPPIDPALFPTLAATHRAPSGGSDAP